MFGSMFASVNLRIGLLFLLLTTLSVTNAKPSDGQQDKSPKIKTLDLDPILAGLKSSNQAVLLFSVLPSRLLLIVSASKQNDLNGAVVFDQKPETMTDSSVNLLPPVNFQDKWPNVTVPFGPMFTVSDAQGGEYLVITGHKQFHLLNLKTGHLSEGLWSGTEIKNNFPNDRAILSLQSEFMKCQILIYSGGNIGIMEANFGGSSLATSQNISSGKNSAFSQPETGQISLTVGGQNVIKWTDWNIATGFVGSSFAYLVNSATSSILKFDQKAMQSPYPAVSVTSIPFNTFWCKAYIPTTKPPAVTSTTARHRKRFHSTFILIGSSVFLLILLLFFACLYCKCRKPAPSPAKPVVSRYVDLRDHYYIPNGIKSDAYAKVKTISFSKAEEAEKQSKNATGKGAFSDLIGPKMMNPTLKSSASKLKDGKRRQSSLKTKQSTPTQKFANSRSSGRLPSKRSSNRQAKSRQSSKQSISKGLGLYVGKVGSTQFVY